MSKALVIGLDLLALGLLIAYWEWRHQVLGWGRGYMRQVTLPKHHRNYIARIEEMVWGPVKNYDHWDVDYDQAGEPRVHISVRREIDMPLPEEGVMSFDPVVVTLQGVTLVLLGLAFVTVFWHTDDEHWPLPGCGYEDSSCKVVRNHMNECLDVAVMFRDPERRPLVIDPEDEYRRYRQWLGSSEGEEFKAAERSVRDKAYRATFEAKIGRERERFGSRPIEPVESPPTS